MSISIRQEPKKYLSVLSKKELVKVVELAGLDNQANHELNTERHAQGKALVTLERQTGLQKWIEGKLTPRNQRLVDAIVAVAQERRRTLRSAQQQRQCDQLSVWVQGWQQPFEKNTNPFRTFLG